MLLLLSLSLLLLLFIRGNLAGGEEAIEVLFNFGLHFQHGRGPFSSAVPVGVAGGTIPVRGPSPYLRWLFVLITK